MDVASHLFTRHLEEIMLPLTDNGWVVSVQCDNNGEVLHPSTCTLYTKVMSMPSVTTGWPCSLLFEDTTRNMLYVRNTTSFHLFIQAVLQKQNETIVQHGIVSICKTSFSLCVFQANHGQKLSLLHTLSLLKTAS